MSQFRKAKSLVDKLAEMIKTKDDNLDQKSVDECERAVMKLYQRSQLQGDAKVYGPKMITKVLALKAKFDEIFPLCKDLLMMKEKDIAEKSKEEDVVEEQEAEVVKNVESISSQDNISSSTTSEDIAEASLRRQRIVEIERQKLIEEKRKKEERRRQREEERRKEKEREASSKMEVDKNLQKTVNSGSANTSSSSKTTNTNNTSLAQQNTKIGGNLRGGATPTVSPPVAPTIATQQSLPHPNPIRELRSETEFNALVLGCRNTLVVVDWYATWCGPCRMIAPALDALARQETSVHFFKVNVDQVMSDLTSPMQRLSSSKGITAMPTFQFYANGQMVDSVKGANIQLIHSKITQHCTKLEDDLIAQALQLSLNINDDDEVDAEENEKNKQEEEEEGTHRSSKRTKTNGSGSTGGLRIRLKTKYGKVDQVELSRSTLGDLVKATHQATSTKPSLQRFVFNGRVLTGTDDTDLEKEYGIKDNAILHFHVLPSENKTGQPSSKIGQPSSRPLSGNASTSSSSSATKTKVFRLRLKSNNGSIVNVKITYNDNGTDSTALLVEDLQRATSEETGIEPRFQRFIFKGRMLKAGKSLVKDYGLQDDAIIHFCPIKSSSTSSTSMNQPKLNNTVSSSGATSIKQAMDSFLANVPAAEHPACLRLLQLYLKNIKKSPDEQKYRKIRKHNARFFKTLGSKPQIDQFMK
eukprot:g316.t1